MKLRTFEKLWYEFNDKCFDSAMMLPRLCRTRSNDLWAYYEDTEGQGTIAINYVNHYQMVAFFFHEMVHQYVEEVLGVEDNDDHGEVFWKTYYERAPYGLEIIG